MDRPSPASLFDSQNGADKRSVADADGGAEKAA